MSGEKRSTGRLQRVRQSFGNGLQHTKNGVTHVQNANFRVWWLGRWLFRSAAAIPVAGAFAVFGADIVDRSKGGSGLAHNLLGDVSNAVTELAQGNGAQEGVALAGRLAVGGAEIGDVANTLAHVPGYIAAKIADIASGSPELHTNIRRGGDILVDTGAIAGGGIALYKHLRDHRIAPPQHNPVVPVG